MTNSQNNHERTAPVAGGDPGKTGDLSAAAQAVAVRAATKVAASRGGAQHVATPAASAPAFGATSAPASNSAVAGKAVAGKSAPQKEMPAQGPSSSKPTRRSARGSDVAAREKQERRETRRHKAHGSERTPSRRATASRRGSRASSQNTTEARAGATSLARGAADSARGARRSASASGSAHETQRASMKYATDNRVVNWLYDLTTGPRRHFFYLIVALLVGVGIYMPVRDFYIAHRTEAILQEQKAIREKYNDSLGKEVESLLSQEGIEDAARRDYGMVMPGEQTITVEGLDEDGNPVVVDVNDQDGEDAAADGDGGDAQDPSTANGAASKDNAGTLKGEDAADKSKTGSDTTDVSSGDTPVTSAEVEAAERAVLENSAWYWKVLDTLFFFDGVNGMAVVSTGE